jgi:hypothetical protein
VTVGLKLRDQFAARIHAGVGDDPDLAVEGKRLALVLGLVGRLQKRVAEADMAVNPDFLGVGAAERYGGGHLSKQMAIHGRSIEMYDANDSAHSGLPAWKDLAGYGLAGMQLDESLREHLVEKAVHILAEAFRLDLELVEQGCMGGLDRGRALENSPDAGPDRVEAEIEFALQVQNHGFVADNAEQHIRGRGYTG